MARRPETRIWIEYANGFDFSGARGARRFPGTSHFFKDHTHLPSPTIVADRIINVIVEEVSVPVWLKFKMYGDKFNPLQPYDCERAPCRTITAQGIAGTHHSQHYIEDDGVTLPARKQQDKPEYRVPSMKEIAELPWNGIKVASTFAGGGGSSLGYRMAGCRVLYANEFVEAARETYRANAAPYTFIDGRDIRTVEAADILEKIGLKAGELDIFDGSPPCASFSTAGKREKHWGKVKSYSDKAQRTDDLFYEYARLLKGLQPKVFVAENVKGLILGTAVGYFREIHEALAACGYRVEARVLNAKWLGVPQSRERTIFVGVRNDLAMDPAFPSPLPYFYSIADAIPWIRRVSSNSSFKQTWKDARRATAQTVTATISEKINIVEAETNIEKYAVGDEYGRLAPGEQSDKYFQLVRAHAGKPVGTITAEGGNPSIASVVHPYEKRKFSIAEVKRLCSFPDDWDVRGTFAQQWERMGRAVPPLMMKAIAEAVRDGVLKHVAGADNGQSKPDRRPRTVRGRADP